MRCDMVVALSRATVQGSTLFGLNHFGACRQKPTLRRFPSADHAPGETLRLGTVQLPQVKRTCTILGFQPAEAWGMTHGISEHRVAAGFCRWQNKLPAVASGLTAPDLVRLALERSQSARQGLDVLTDLLCRHKQRSADGDETGDGIFLLADPTEAFVVESAGGHWASLECQHVRAVSDVGLIRQDWRRLSPGLSEFAKSNGWWVDDGSKLDLAGSLAAPTGQTPWALKRWGNATWQLEQQDGHIDSFFLRRMLCDHYETSARSAPAGVAPELQSSFLAVLPMDSSVLPVAWCTFGPSPAPLFLPILLEGDWVFNERIDTFFSHFDTLLDSPQLAAKAKETLDRLQARIDQQTDEFLDECRTLQAEGNGPQIARLAGVLMQNHAELLEAECPPQTPLEEGAAATRPFAPHRMRDLLPSASNLRRREWDGYAAADE